MPTKKATKMSVKSSKISEKKVETKTDPKKDKTKKVVIKRRKTELKPTKASAVAIASQANRAKKALIEKVANSDVVHDRKEVSNTKVPLWVWVFFGCSLMFFCITFYQAMFHSQLKNKVVDNTAVTNIDYSEDNEKGGEVSLLNGSFEDANSIEEISEKNNTIVQNPQNPEELIQTYFAYMSKGDFDESFNLFDDRTQNDKNIREHFTAFRMAPFFEGIEGKAIIPKNIHKISETYKGNDVYSFDISYVLDSTHEQYDETWKFSTSNRFGELKILMLYCVSSRCAKHPIFGPEDFGLMR